MTHRWLTAAMATAIAVCALAGLRAVGESRLSVDMPPDMLFDNPFAKPAASQTNQNKPKAAEKPPESTPVTVMPPAVEPAPEKPAAPTAVAPIEVAPPQVSPPVQTQAAPETPELPTAETATVVEGDEASNSNQAPTYALPEDEILPAEFPPSEEWQAPAPDVDDIELPPSSHELPAQVSSLPRTVETTAPIDAILPVPIEPQNEMLDALESIWPMEDPTETHPDAGSARAVPYTPTVAELSHELLPTVRHAYALAQRGAIYAAQAEFIQILRRIAQAKDAEQGTEEHSRALAAGLRALDEADDFMPAGVQLEAELNVAVIASSHRTPVIDDAQRITAKECIIRYHEYAQQQLGACAAGERAGSMALYGLGKIQNRLANESNDELRHQRKALVLFQAALVAGPQNHLAANEIGVLLARSGRPTDAAKMFRRAIDVAPTSTNYYNLAMVEQKLGRFDQANANARYAEQLAARDRVAGAVSRAKGVTWVAPQDMARTSATQQPPMPPIAPMAVGAPAAPPQPERRVVLPRGPSGPVESADVSTAAQWPQKLVPNTFRR